MQPQLLKQFFRVPEKYIIKWFCEVKRQKHSSPRAGAQGSGRVHPRRTSWCHKQLFGLLGHTSKPNVTIESSLFDVHKVLTHTVEAMVHRLTGNSKQKKCKKKITSEITKIKSQLQEKKSCDGSQWRKEDWKVKTLMRWNLFWRNEESFGV